MPLLSLTFGLDWYYHTRVVTVLHAAGITVQIECKPRYAQLNQVLSTNEYFGQQ